MRVLCVLCVLVLLVVTAGAAFVAGLVVGPRAPSACFDRSIDVELAKVAVAKYAHEAFPRWAAAHPDAACPPSLRELESYVPRAAHRDPWGQPYAFTCGGGRLYAVSLGPDRHAGTADDIWSHE